MLQLRDTHNVAWKAYVISRVIRHSVHTAKNTPHLRCKRTLLSVKRNTCLLFWEPCIYIFCERSCTV